MLECFFYLFFCFVDSVFSFFLAFIKLGSNFLVFFWVGVFEGEVFKFCFEASHAEPVGEWCVDVECFLCYSCLFLFVWEVV